MKVNRELLTGLLAAIVSVIIISGSLIIALMEDGIPIALAITDTPHPTIVIPTTRPGEPTLTPSLTNTPTETDVILSSPPQCPIPSNWVIVTINVGDTLEKLAQIYNLNPADLGDANCLFGNTLIPGSTFYVPAPLPSNTPTKTATQIPCGPPIGWVRYTVKAGDTLYSLGVAYGVSVYRLQVANCLGGSTHIKTGQQIRVPNVPTRTPIPSSTPIPTHTFTPTLTPTHPTPTNTIFVPPTNTSTPTPTPTPSSTSAVVPDTQTPTSTNSPTSTSTNTATQTPAPTNTSTPENTPTDTPTGSG